VGKLLSKIGQDRLNGLRDLFLEERVEVSLPSRCLTLWLRLSLLLLPLWRRLLLLGRHRYLLSRTFLELLIPRYNAGGPERCEADRSTSVSIGPARRVVTLT
jgi:hypothetical protein